MENKKNKNINNNTKTGKHHYHDKLNLYDMDYIILYMI